MSDFKANNKPVTLDDLATMIAKGFDNTATKKDLQKVEGKVDKLEGRFDKFEGRFDKLEGKVDKMDERLQIVETKLDRALYSEYVHLETRVKRLEESMGIKK